MAEKTMQGLAVLALASVGAYFRQLEFPVILLVVAMVLDYITGMTEAWIKGELSSKIGIIGIIKKLGYMVAVAVAVVVDMIIASALESANITGYPNIFALLVTIWLTLNECISILENLNEIGVPVPDFLVSIIKKLKQATEDKGNGDQPKPQAVANENSNE